MEDIKYRRAKKSDIGFLIALLKELTALEEDFPFNDVKHRTGFNSLLSASEDKVCIVVAEYNDEIIGMCSGQAVISTAMGGGSVWVEDVIVSSKFRGRKVGRNLLLELSEWAKSIDAKRMQLWADKNNFFAIEFYKKNGWQLANGIVLKANL